MTFGFYIPLNCIENLMFTRQAKLLKLPKNQKYCDVNVSQV